MAFRKSNKGKRRFNSSRRSGKRSGIKPLKRYFIQRGGTRM